MDRNIALLITLSIFIVSCKFLAYPVLSIDESNESPWITKEPVPVAGDSFKAGVVDDKIYAIMLSATYEYNLCSWSTKKPMPTSRGDFALAAYQDKIYCIGGRTNSGPVGANEVYDPATNSWESKTAMPTPRHGFDANVVKGKIYLISGLVPNHLFPDVEGTFELTTVNEVYDPSTDTWTTKTPIPNAASYYASAVVNDKIFIISENLTQIYDPATDSWSYGASPPFSVDMAGCATVAGVTPQRIYVIGGRLSTLEVAYNQVYSPENDSWNIGSPMLTARYGLAVAVANGKVYAMGGFKGMDVSVIKKDTNEQYDPLKDENIPVAPAPSPTPTQSTPTLEPIQEPFPILPVAATSVIVAVIVGAGLLVYFRKRRR